jgi:hypothetical protein
MPPKRLAPLQQGADRGDHLKNLVRIFRRRGCDWDDFGRWLEYVFYSHESKHRLSVLSGCRHDPAKGPLCHTFSGTTCCMTSGTKDNGKAMKFVSFDLRDSAREWCATEGHSKLAITEASVKASPAIQPEEDVLDDSVLDEQEAGDEDTWAEQLGLNMSAEFSSSPLHSSVVDAPRTSTGIRAHVLAYLAKFRADPAELEVQYRLLRDTPTPILHLCGCGICNHGPACIEPGHLRLGNQRENLNHAHWHAMLKASEGGPIADYLWLCRFIEEKCPDGQGVF